MMALRAVLLDSYPVGLVTQRTGQSPEGDACRAWMTRLLAADVDVYIPKIIDYEVRRELIRAGKTSGILRLDNLKSLAEYLPITTTAMQKAAELWAQARNSGQPTADPKALDGDVILAAQALTLGLQAEEFVIATDNVRHISRYAPAKRYQDINM